MIVKRVKIKHMGKTRNTLKNCVKCGEAPQYERSISMVGNRYAYYCRHCESREALLYHQSEAQARKAWNKKQSELKAEGNGKT